MNKLSAPAIDRAAAAELIGPLTRLAIASGSAILAIDRSAMSRDDKADGSPVTQADLAADQVIAEGLARLLPAVPVVSEERLAGTASTYTGSFFLVDPLDGTKEFIAGRDEYTVNLALIVDGTPLLGIVAAPALGLLWRGLVGRGAERVNVTPGGEIAGVEPIHTRKMPPAGNPWIAAVSRSHRDPRSEALIDARRGAVRRVLGSAVKFCRVAEGGADLYPRLAPTCEWDIAAGHAVVVAAGGKVTDSKGAPIRFGIGREKFVVPEFLAWGDPTAAP